MPSSSGWRIRVPATTANLGPGFDCIGLALQRYLHLTIYPAGEPGAWSISSTGEGADVLPRDKTNLVYRSLVLAAGIDQERIPGLQARMANGIPLARGQGSSAAAIVAGMAAGQLIARGEVDRDTLISQASLVEGHSDNVAAAVMGGLVLTHEIGGKVRVRRVPTHDGVSFVSAIPEFELATLTSRAILPKLVPHTDAVHNVSAAAWLAAAWSMGDWQGVAEAMDDRLHEPYRAALVRGFNEVRDAARRAGALAACLSGSGPSILALTVGEAERVARAMEDAWHALGIASRAEVTEVDTEGLVIQPNDGD